MRDILGDYELFVRGIAAGLTEFGITRVEVIQMDHICYRVETQERYQELKRRLGDVAELVSESQVNGREIATFELVEPLQVDEWVIPYLELPAPKPGSLYKEGWEHVELVTSGSLKRFMARHTELPFSQKGMGKLINPELSLKTNKLSVKFHEQPLGAVARIEQRLQDQGIDYDK